MKEGRIARRFATLRAQNRKALLAYIVAGDPQPSATLPVMHSLVRAGVDVIELGLPFTDPEAEGPVIQAAHERALQHRVSLAEVLELVAEFRREDDTTPVILMGYLNPVERMGPKVFARRARDCRLDGALLVNLPPEEGGVLRDAMREQGLDLIHLLAPTSSEQRAADICAVASGFIYYVSLLGVTGAGHLDVRRVAERLLPRKRQLGELPVVVGFGIKDGASARALAALADGVVIGSVIVELFHRHRANPAALPDAVESLVRKFREALDAAS